MNFLKALLYFIRMYRDGFYFSGNETVAKNGNRWGFYRFNHRCQGCMFDVDYDFNGVNNYFHVHGDDYRADFDKKMTLLNLVETPMKNEHEARIWWLR